VYTAGIPAPPPEPARARVLDEVALLRALPALAAQVPWVRLGDWPTPVVRLADRPWWVKREDLTSTVYGGNKVRTLEVALGQARAAGADEVWATGAYGSNHALATAAHAPAAGLAMGGLLFPQPASEPAMTNLDALLAHDPRVVLLSSVIELPFAMAWLRRRRGARAWVMPPGAATPMGALGAASAAFELALQHAAGRLPWPRRVVLPVGSGCTTAGLLAGFHLAHALDRAPAPPRIVAVRVTPWPITSRLRLARLAHATAATVDRLRGADSRIGLGALYAGLEVDGRFLGRGYGHATAAGSAARARMAALGGPALDDVYAAKAAARLFAGAPDGTRGAEPTLFWATKSSAPLPRATPAQLDGAPPALRRWLGRR
jgi:1-aminocyclopropane-1-carboxylate deaminase/D-cysteine desulfhydrase-like pyridoxal-dependent ACC family enzyme